MIRQNRVKSEKETAVWEAEDSDRYYQFQAINVWCRLFSIKKGEELVESRDNALKRNLVYIVF